MDVLLAFLERELRGRDRGAEARANDDHVEIKRHANLLFEPSDHRALGRTGFLRSREGIARVQMLKENQNLMDIVGMRVFAGDLVLDHIEGVLNALVIVDVNVR